MSNTEDADAFDVDWEALGERVLEASRAVLAEAGPLPIGRLAELLAEAGVLDPLLDRRRGAGHRDDDLVDVVDQVLLETDDVISTPDDMVALAASVLDGLVLTHRITQSELDREVIDTTPDLGVLDWNLGDGMDLAGGGRVTHEYSFADQPEFEAADENGSFFGPPGWLDGLADGDLVALARTGESLSVVRVDDPPHGVDAGADVDRVVASLAEAFERQVGDDDTLGAEPDWVLLDVIVHDLSLFRTPHPPLDELLDRAGLERDGAWVGRKGSEWEPPGVRWRENAKAHLFDRYRFDSCCIEAFEEVRAAYSAFVLGDAPLAEADPKRLARLLAHGSVVLAMADDLFTIHRDGSDRLDGFAATLATAVTGANAGAAHYLRAVNAERQGRVLDAEAELTSAVRSDPELAFAQLELARYASDRGDIPGALSRFAKAGVPADEPEVAFLRGLLPDTTGVGRNDPCPCGSGRRFKQCHLRDTSLPIERRSGWLFNKVVMFVTSAAHRANLVGLASTAAGANCSDEIDDDEFGQVMVRFVGALFLVSVASCEGGGLEAFLARRGVLLPPDELAVAYEWLEQPRRLWEVISVEPGTSLTLRDTATGDELVVAEQAASGELGVGEYLLAVVVPVGDEHHMLGDPVRISLRLRPSVLSLLDGRPSADEIADWYGWATRPPEMANREGELISLRVGRATPSIAWAALADGLDSAYDRTGGREGGDDEGERWVEHHTLDDGEVIVRTFLRRDGGDLVFETNSDSRWERVVAVVRSLDPGAAVVDEPETRDALSWPDWAPLGAGTGVAGDDEVSPEAAAAVAEMMLDYETAWLDESIPALDGLTPREAADDPTRREDLLALLRSFEGIDLPGGLVGFDPGRIRAALGLAPDT